jgi:hypothetical protein
MDIKFGLYLNHLPFDKLVSMKADLMHIKQTTKFYIAMAT